MSENISIVDVLEKAETGPLTTAENFDKEFIYKPIKQLINTHDIRWDKDLFVPAEDTLADRLFDAGLKLAQESGVLCINTSRRILFSKDELERALNSIPSSITLGEGANAVTLAPRKPDENRFVAVCGGPFSPVPEELFEPLLISYAQEPLIDILDSAALSIVYGHPIKGGSPWEALGCWREAHGVLEIIRRVGRPGMSISCAETSTTAIGEVSTTTYGAFRPSDFHHVSLASELKTSYDELTKAVHFIHTGSRINAFYAPLYGGYVGGKEGLAIAIVAGMILLQACFSASTVGPAPGHISLSCNTFPDMIAAESLAFQALSRNTRLITVAFVRPIGGPGTKSILYETAAKAIANVPAGVAMVKGVQQSLCLPGHASGLEARFCAQVTHASEKITRQDADWMVRKLVNLYAGGLSSRPTGKRFDEVYDLESIRPKEFWEQIYLQVSDEIEKELGLKL